jgi:hypothetical protein
MVEPSEKNESLESSSEVGLDNVHLEPWETLLDFLDFWVTYLQKQTSTNPKWSKKIEISPYSCGKLY